MNNSTIINLLNSNLENLNNKAFELNGSVITKGDLRKFLRGKDNEFSMVLTKNDFEICLPQEHSLSSAFKNNFDTVKIFVKTNVYKNVESPRELMIKAVKEFGITK